MADETEGQAAETTEVEMTEAAPKAEKAAKPAKADKAEKAEKAGKAEKGVSAYQPRLKSDYEQRIVPAMIERFGYKNRMEVPRLDKIVLNMGVGEATQDKKKVEAAAAEMQAIAGQRPVISKA